MGKKVYAIKEGFDFKKGERVQNKIVMDWNSCLGLVKGVKGAKYKSFQSLDEAKEYLKDDKKLLIKGVDFYPQDCMHIYVDGSYNTSTKKYSYGLVAVENNIIKYMENGVAEDSSESRLRQILGELKGALRAYEYAIKSGKSKIVIFHDYEGIFHHAIGTWDRKDSSSKDYHEKFNNYREENNLEVIFVKVDSHTGDLFNEITDNYAKVAAGLELTSAVDKLLKTEKLVVENINLKDEVSKVLKKKDFIHNIMVYGATIEKCSTKEIVGRELHEDNFYKEISNENQESIKRRIEKLKSKELKDDKIKYLKSLKKDELIGIILDITN